MVKGEALLRCVADKFRSRCIDASVEDGACRNHVAVGKLDDVEHAEEEREPHRDERVHHPQHRAVDDVLAEQAERHGYLPASFRLPVAYSLSSQSAHLPSCTTYLVMAGTVFCP